MRYRQSMSKEQKRIYSEWVRERCMAAVTSEPKKRKLTSEIAREVGCSHAIVYNSLTRAGLNKDCHGRWHVGAGYLLQLWGRPAPERATWQDVIDEGSGDDERASTN